MSATTTEGTGHGAVQTSANYQIDKRLVVINNTINTGGGGYMNLTSEIDGETLPEDKSIFFVSTSWESGSFTAYLPNPANVAGKELTFVGTSIDSEYAPIISGPYGPASEENLNYILNNTWVVKMVSDGANYWITSQQTFD